LFNLKNDIIIIIILIMDNFNSDKYYETLLNNFTKNYQYYLNLNIKTKNPINISIKKNNNKKVSWNEENLINIYYYSNDE
tara:strand:+ start:778 stop:1017 length:240 start_codon:yes stop_codon:yes gene_type:complete